MGVHVCTPRLALLALFHAVLLQLAAARTLRQRLDLSRRTATARAQQAPAADVTEGTEIILVLNPPKGGGTPSEQAVEDLKFAIANEAMRPMPLQNFLSKHGMNPKARLPPLRTITPGSGAATVTMESIPLDMTVPEDAPSAAPTPAPPPPEVPQLFFPKGYETTGPPVAGPASRGDLRQSLTTAAPPYDPAWTGPTSNDLLGYGLGGSMVSNLQACKDTCRAKPPCQAIHYSATETWKGKNCFIFEFQRKQFVVSSPEQQFKSFQIWKYDRSADPAPLTPAPAAAPGPAVASTTQIMMIREDAYATASVQTLTNMVRMPNGDVLECTHCKCVKRVNGGVQAVEDPTCQ